MPERDRLLHPVTGSLAAVFLMLLLAGLISHANRYHLESPASVGMISPNVDVSQEPAKSSQQQAYDEADLQAQQSMALAAWFAVAVSGTGLVGLLFTVRYALFAWKAAQKSADADEAALVQTRLATMAAFKTEESTREIGQKQATAYLYAASANVPVRQTLTHGVDNALLSALQKRAMLSVKLRNIGQTMAKNVYLKFELCDERKGAWEVHRELNGFKSLRTSNIAPGQDFDVIIYQDILKDIRESAASEDRLKYPLQMRTLRGDIIYEDVFTNIFRTAFIFVLFYNITKEEAPEEEMPCLLMPNNAPAFEKVGVEHYNDS